MQSKLTLRLDEELIKSADKKMMPLGPVTSKLAGSLKGAKLNEDDYKNHLARKYL
jgi:hypothetical protein